MKKHINTSLSRRGPTPVQPATALLLMHSTPAATHHCADYRRLVQQQTLRAGTCPSQEATTADNSTRVAAACAPSLLLNSRRRARHHDQWHCQPRRLYSFQPLEERQSRPGPRCCDEARRQLSTERYGWLVSFLIYLYTKGYPSEVQSTKRIM